MKASELMVGNWVRRRWTCTDTGREVVRDFQITEIRKNGETLYAWGKSGNMGLVEKLEPIPITPEILEKNGFDVLSHENPAAFAYKKEDVSIVEVYWNGPERGYRCIFSYGDTRLRITCHFVYELQHAIHLCGVDKEIEL